MDIEKRKKILNLAGVASIWLIIIATIWLFICLLSHITFGISLEMERQQCEKAGGTYIWSTPFFVPGFWTSCEQGIKVEDD
jgi:hypothetical protein